MIVAASLGLIAFYLLAVVCLHIKKARLKKSRSKRIAFFHPFCNDGGGGEKVLWSLIESLVSVLPPDAPADQYQNQPSISVYSLDGDVHQILSKANSRFNINLLGYAHRIQFIKVSGRSLLTPKSQLTMVCHILLPLVYCFKCLWKYQPDIFYDTTGFAFNFSLVKLLMPSVECWAYVHYPFISEDMVAKIRDRRADFNNDASISKSAWKTKAKLVYYQIILKLYRLLRVFVSAAQANSTWTQDHMTKLWGPLVTKLYPPCSISKLLSFQKDYNTKSIKIVSLAQFRPEKNHALQISVVKKLVQRLQKEHGQKPMLHLYICGTTRGADDERILESLKAKVQMDNLSQHISFCVNMKFSELLSKLEECNYAIHSMEAEHFGISIVQMLAAGCLVVAHNSAGPKFDIIRDDRFLASSEQEYSEKIYSIIQMRPQDKAQQAAKFRKLMDQFGEDSFRHNFRAIFSRHAKEQ